MAANITSATSTKDIFKDVRFFLAEENNEEVKQALKSGGATREFYISDLVTHVIASDTSFPQYIEAKDYSLTIVQPKWVFTSAKCEMLLPCAAFQPTSDQLFKGLVMCPSQIPVPDRDALWAMITFYGGKCQLNLRPQCTHLVIPQPSGAKYECAVKHPNSIKIVTPSWIVDCVKEKTLLDEGSYKPQKEEEKSQAGTASSLLTPDEVSNKTTSVELPTTETCISEKSSTDSTPITTCPKATVALSSTMMSPVSPVVTTATVVDISVPESTNDSKISPKRDQSAKEDGENTEKPLGRESDVFTPTGTIELVENNNEKLVQHTRDEKLKEHAEEKNNGERSSRCLADCVFVISDYPECMDHSILDTWIEVNSFSYIHFLYYAWRTVMATVVLKALVVIEQHGGTVSPFYSKRCTHLLCLHQHGSLYQQAILEGKRIVTAHWLNDVLTAKAIRPPSNPLHLPVPFKDKVPQCRNMVITVTGYAGAERTLLKNMIFIIGAKYTGYLTRSNTHIICKSSTGEKYSKAREWGVHCVNAKWLGDIVTAGYPSPCNLVRYTMLGDPSELELTKDLLVRELILPWQTFVAEKSCAQISNNAKRKLDDQSTPENGQVRKIRRITSPDAPNRTDAPKILFTGVPPLEVSKLTEMVNHLGGILVTTAKHCTHLVTKKIIRTVKFLCAISVTHYVITPDWITTSHEKNKFLDPNDFKVADSASEELFGMELRTSIQRARTKPLLQDIMVYVTQNVEPSPSSMKEIIQCAGGQVLTSVPSQQNLTELKRKSVQEDIPSLLVISCEKDLNLCSDFIKKGFDIHNAELILSGVLKQQLDLDLFKL